MFIDLSPGAVGIKGLTFPQLVDLATRHGFEGVDLPADEVGQMAEPTQAAELLQKAGLKWGGFGLPVNFRKDDAAFEKDLETLKRHAAIAQKVGCTRCPTWIMPGSNDLEYKPNFDLHARRLRRCAAILADHGARLGIELVGTKTVRDKFKHPFVHTVDQILELAAAIGYDTGLLLDCFHWFTALGTTDDILNKMPGKVVYVHVNDARPNRTPEQQIDNERALPCDTGVIDLKSFVSCLRKIKYDGPVAAEPFMPELGQLPPDDCAKRVAASVKKMMSLA